MLQSLNTRLSLNRRLLQRSYRSPWLQVVRGLVQVTHPRTKGRRRRAIAALSPGPAVRAAGAALHSEGFAVLTDLVDTKIMQAMISRGSDLAATTTPMQNGRKIHWQQLLTKEDQQAPDSAFLALGLQPELLAAVALALGEAPRLRSVTLHRSLPSPVNTISQLWHRDFDGLEVIKIFAYLSDVTAEANGPFTFFPARASGTVCRWGRNHLEDREIFDRLNPAERHSMIGPAGTVFTINTHRCLHMGSRVAPGHERLMVTVAYIPAPSLYIGQKPPANPRAGAPELERLALE